MDFASGALLFPWSSSLMSPLPAMGGDELAIAFFHFGSASSAPRSLGLEVYPLWLLPIWAAFPSGGPSGPSAYEG